MQMIDMSTPYFGLFWMASPTIFLFDDNATCGPATPLLAMCHNFKGRLRIEYAAVGRRITGVDALHHPSVAHCRSGEKPRHDGDCRGT